MTQAGIYDIDLTKLVLPFDEMQRMFEGQGMLTCLACRTELNPVKLDESLMAPYEAKEPTMQIAPYRVQSLSVEELDQLIKEASDELVRRVDTKKFVVEGMYEDNNQSFSHWVMAGSIEEAIHLTKMELAGVEDEEDLEASDPGIVVHQVRVGMNVVWAEDD